jgi:hypothetical protein
LLGAREEFYAAVELAGAVKNAAVKLAEIFYFDTPRRRPSAA